MEAGVVVTVCVVEVCNYNALHTDKYTVNNLRILFSKPKHPRCKRSGQELKRPC